MGKFSVVLYDKSSEEDFNYDVEAENHSHAMNRWFDLVPAFDELDDGDFERMTNHLVQVNESLARYSDDDYIIFIHKVG